MRRKFVEAIPSTVEADEPPTLAQQGRNYCDQLSAKENKIMKLEPGERQKHALRKKRRFSGLFGAGWMNFRPSRWPGS